jgi:polysaccharide export outer membrane protein
MIWRSFVFTLLSTLFVVGGCSSYRPAPEAFHKAINQPYILGAGDQLRITVYGQDSLTNAYSVDQAGTIAFPLIGSLVAKGRTSTQLEADIAKKLRDGYLRNPDVSVEVAQYRPIFIMGEVGASGQYSYVPGMTIQKAVAAAGGFTPRALQDMVDVTREIDGRVMTARVNTSDPVLPGDAIYVRERLF